MNPLQSLLEGVRETLTARTAYGDPVERDGVTVIPAAIDPVRIVGAVLVAIVVWSLARRR